MEESVEDMTAADTAPKPMNATHVGVRYWKGVGGEGGNVKRQADEGHQCQTKAQSCCASISFWLGEI